MNFLSGFKTYTGGVGLILAGIGGFMHGDFGLYIALGMISTGIVTVGARSFGQKMIDVVSEFKPIIQAIPNLPK